MNAHRTPHWCRGDREQPPISQSKTNKIRPKCKSGMSLLSGCTLPTGLLVTGEGGRGSMLPFHLVPIV